MSPPSKVLALGEAIMAAAEATGDMSAIQRVKDACAEASAEEKHETGKYKGMHGLALAIRAAVETKNGKTCDKEWGYELLDTVLVHGLCRADARLQGHKTAMMLSAHFGRDDLCDLLLDAKADPCAKDTEGVTPVHTACMNIGGANTPERAHKSLKLLLMRGGKKVSDTVSDTAAPGTHTQRPGRHVARCALGARLLTVWRACVPNCARSSTPRARAARRR